MYWLQQPWKSCCEAAWQHGQVQVDEGWALLASLTDVKKEPAAPPAKAAPAVKKEPAASPSPHGFSFASPPPFGASRAAPPTTFKASPPAARPAAAGAAAAARSPARKRCAAGAAAGAGASPAKRTTRPASQPARVGGAGAPLTTPPPVSPAPAAAGVSSKEATLGCASLARSDSSSPGCSITLSPPPIHNTPPHPSRGEVRSSSSGGSGRRGSAAPRSPIEEHPSLQRGSARGPTTAGGAAAIGREGGSRWARSPCSA